MALKQQLSVHSEDRDIKKWPQSNTFEVDLPVDYRNVAMMRLNDIDLPASFSVFSLENQNTKFSFIIAATTYIVEITSGTYTPTQMGLELTGQMNAAYNNAFLIVYNEISQTFLFSGTDPFALDFTASLYDGTYYNNYAAWGLGYNLGFQKKKYISNYSTVEFYWNSTSYTNKNIITSTNTIDLLGDSVVYMEVFQFNSMDEIMPYTERSNHMFGAKQGGKHNSAFAKIPIGNRYAYECNFYMDRHNLVTNIFRSEPPLERIQKLKFKFRFHDGRLVDFGNREFSFTLELTLARTDIPNFTKE